MKCLYLRSISGHTRHASGACSTGAGPAKRWEIRLPESRSQLNRAVENTPDSIRLQTALSHVAYASADYGRAIEATRALILSDPSSRLVHEIRLTNYLVASDRREEATKIVTKYRDHTLDPHSSFLMASTFAGLGNPAEARRYLEAWDAGIPKGSGSRGQYDWWLRHDPNFQSLPDPELLEDFLSRATGSRDEPIRTAGR